MALAGMAIATDLPLLAACSARAGGGADAPGVSQRRTKT